MNRPALAGADDSCCSGSDHRKVMVLYLLVALGGALGSGLVTVEKARILHYRGEPKAAPPPPGASPSQNQPLPDI